MRGSLRHDPEKRVAVFRKDHARSELARVHLKRKLASSVEAAQVASGADLTFANRPRFAEHANVGIGALAMHFWPDAVPSVTVISRAPGNIAAFKKYLKLEAAGYKSAGTLNPPHVNVWSGSDSQPENDTSTCRCCLRWLAEFFCRLTLLSIDICSLCRT